MAQREIGKLERVPLREIWPLEDRDFTPWLAGNLDQLGEQLSMRLELDRAEMPVGPFSLDILARNLDTQTVVAIENQIADTDHSHLGQLLTYAAGVNAEIMIWIAARFRDEHRAAIDRLNEATDDTMNFFGVEVEAVRIGDSLNAPLFRAVAVPNAWLKSQPGNPGEMTETRRKYMEYWKPLLEELSTRYGWGPIKTVNSTNEYLAGSGLGRGFGSFGRTMRFTSANQAKVELTIQKQDKDWNKAVFDTLLESCEQIEAEMGPMVWERLDDYAMSRIGVAKPGSIRDPEEELENHRSWMIGHVSKFPSVLRPYLEDAQREISE